MLTSIGKKTKSLLVKIFVGIIILPFIFWGMGDVFRGGNLNIVASIDNEKISTQEFLNYVNRLNLSDQERKDFKKTDLLEKILSDYTGRKIIALEVENFGISISDSSLKNIIINDKTFFKDGKFSRTAYEKFLLQSTITAPMFEQNIKEQEKKRQLLSFLSNGVMIPDFLIEDEFKKENQIKKIKYIDLNIFYKNKPRDEEKVKKIYDDNKSIFVEEFKSISFVELDPTALIGNSEFNESFFNKINIIENDALDGKSINQVVEENSLELIKTEEINKNKLNSSGAKSKIINDSLFNKVFPMKKTNSAEVFNINNKYYLAEVTSSKIKNKDINDKEVIDAINQQINITNKLENNTKIVKEISLGQFDFNKMNEFANKNNLKVENITIENLNNNKIFTDGLIKRIYSSKDGEINLITDSTLSKNFIIYVENTEYKKLDKNSDTYEKYKSKAKASFGKEVYYMYDNYVNNRYNVDINQKAIDRIKNSL